jgi:hypothetical protein
MQGVTADTVYRWWRFPYVGIGVGWTLGRMELFDQWATPLKQMPFDAASLDTSVSLSQFNYADVEKPNSYSTAFPLFISYSPWSGEKSNLATFIEFNWMKKTSKGIWRTADTARYWHRLSELRYTNLALGAQYYHDIPEDFFRIDGVSRTAVNIGLSLSPLLAINQHQRDSSNLLMSVDDHRATYFGLGASWRLGLATFQTLQSGNGLEAGIMYEGGWNGNFTGGHQKLSWGDINPSSSRKDNLFSSINHRFKIYFQVLLTKKKPRPPESKIDTTQLPAAVTPAATDSSVVPSVKSDSVAVPAPSALPPQSLPVDSASGTPSDAAR